MSEERVSSAGRQSSQTSEDGSGDRQQDEDRSQTAEEAGEQNLDAECERLLRNTKKQVKQMLEEAVTKKFIHEESSSIISLCVAIDACLSHGLKRRTLGLFKTNSSTALVQKCAKHCASARAVLRLVEEEERRQQLEEQQQQQQLMTRKRSVTITASQPLKQNQHQLVDLHWLTANGALQTPPFPPATSVPNSLARQQLQQWHLHGSQSMADMAKQQSAILNTNKELHRRHLWLKCALIEKKLLDIVEFLAENAANYYEKDALMANRLGSQLLCSLLVGQSALEFSRSKSTDYYQFEEPSADELLKRHKLSQPIACLCALGQDAASPALGQRRGSSSSAELARGNNLFSSLTTSGAHSGQASSEASDVRPESPAGQQQLLRRASSRRRPLALKNNLASGALVTDCHHCSCKEISEHQQTRGYSFKSKDSAAAAAAAAAAMAAAQQHQNQQGLLSPACASSASASSSAQTATTSAPTQTTTTTQTCGSTSGAESAPNAIQDQFTIWSPRVLHETLHQNSRSSLLYAKNNVLLETQAHGLMAGYLSLHQTSSDLIIKWIPNQLINGGGGGGAGGNDENNEGQDSALNRANGLTEADGEDNNHQGAGSESAGNQEQSLSIPAELSRAVSQESNKCRSQQQQQSVGGSYLELVVSLSVARIVLLHCHFVPSPSCSSAPASGRTSACAEEGSADGDTPTGERASLGAEQQAGAALGCASGDDSSVAQATPMETLILVEADGAQRAPFKFPKAGLRWFLSCLESGLHPERYLELAIKPDGWPDWPWADDDALAPADSGGGSSSGNNSLGGPTAPGTQLHSGADGGAGEQALAAGRLDTLLRRLPSLKRPRRAGVAPKSCASGSTTSASSCFSASDSASLCSPRAASIQQQQQQQQLRPLPGAGQLSIAPGGTLNYVYRIVSTLQHDWPLPTPPHSALSVTSSVSSTGSLGGPAGGLANAARWSRLTGPHALASTSQSSQSSDGGSGQRFLWSLSRLARLQGSRQSAAQGENSSLGSLGEDLTPAPSLGQSHLASEEEQQLEGRIKRDSSSELIRIEAKLSELNETPSGDLVAQRDQSLQTLCESMRKRIQARAFYGWLAHCRRTKIIRTHLLKLVRSGELASRLGASNHKQVEPKHGDEEEEEQAEETRESDGGNSSGEENNCHLLDSSLEASQFGVAKRGLTEEQWDILMDQLEQKQVSAQELGVRVAQLVYYGGCETVALRRQVWPYLLGHYRFGDSVEARRARDRSLRQAYESRRREWSKIERVIKRRDNEILAANMARVERRKRQQEGILRSPRRPSELVAAAAAASQRQTVSGDEGAGSRPIGRALARRRRSSIGDWREETPEEDEGDKKESVEDGNEEEEEEEEVEEEEEEEEEVNGVDGGEDTDGPQQSGESLNKLATNGRNPNDSSEREPDQRVKKLQFERMQQRRQRRRRPRLESTGSVGSDASITDQFGNNIHRIDKDVQRCDRQFWYFKETENLNKLRNIMCSYVWQNLKVGYVQGMCDLAAPFLVVFDDEFEAFCCFQQLMKRMVANFPHGNAMDQHFESLKYLMQVLDPKLFEVLQKSGDYTHFYFCYRWLLLDFKRELTYQDVYRVWETIWSARKLVSNHFVVFLALAMVRYYRDIIIENNMDFTDTIKFFNEMAERHDVSRIIELAQDCVVELKGLIG